MSQQSLKRAIDRMVEQSIREILPRVVTEVLVKAIADSGVLQERVGRIQRPVTEQVPGRPQAQPARPKRTAPSASSLRELLDEGAGAEFYGNPSAESELDDDFQEIDERPEERPVLARRLEHLNPELRQLAEDMDLSDDGIGEMWDDGEHGSGIGPGAVNEIRDPVKAAKSVGLDFSRMAQTIKTVEPPKQRTNPSDAAAKAQFEEERLKRKREMLGSKTVG